MNPRFEHIPTFLVGFANANPARHGDLAVTARYRICCVTRSALLNHDRRIRGIGGVNPDGAHWQISEAQAIAAIEEGRWSFFVEREGRDLPVVIAVSKYGLKYIKAAEDALHPDGLLALPDCL